MSDLIREARAEFEQGAAREIVPHWPSYHAAMRDVRDLPELFDAERHRDMGDVVALKGAAERLKSALQSAADDGLLPEFVADIWASVLRFRKISDKQGKAIALALARAATLRGAKN